MEIISRSEAKSQGFKHYYTGLPCKHGHLSARFTNSSICIACNLIKANVWYKNNQAAGKEKSKKYREENPVNYKESKKRCYLKKQEYYKKKSRVWNSNNKEKSKLNSIVYFENNKHSILEYQSKWRKENRKHLNSENAKRRSLKIRATPLWANMEKVESIYKNCPDGYQVDHIVPLNSKLVCGLHCEFNLQYLTAFENVSKGNRHWPNMP